MPIPWSDTLLPEAAVAGLVTAVAAGAVGGFVGGALVRPAVAAGLNPEHAGRARMGRTERRAALAGLLVLVAVIGWGLPVSSSRPESARVTLREVEAPGGRAVDATVRIRPADGAEGAHFINVTAWQGGGSVVAELEDAGLGVYRTREPVPVHGSWKALVRLHVDDALLGVPIFLPRDRAIPAPQVPARPQFTREFVRDVEILQRERKEGVAGWLTVVAYLAVAAIAAGLIALLAWALLRLDAGAETGGRSRPAARAAGGRSRERRPELV